MTDSKTLRIGISNAPFSLFAWWGLLTEKVSIDGFDASISAGDQHAINSRAALPGTFDVAMLSSSSVIEREGAYVPLEIGAFPFEATAPVVVASGPLPIDDLKATKVGLPGESTTETLLGRSCLPAFTEVQMDAGAILDAVQSGSVRAAILSKEILSSRVDAQAEIIEDLGERFATYHDGLQVPSAVTCASSQLADETRRAVEVALASSIATARDCFEEAVAYVTEEVPGSSPESIADLLKPALEDDAFALSEKVTQALAVLQEYAEADYYAANGRF